jgi:predicted RNase H-like nuclease (RuvC/YqgF family)
MAYEEVIRRCHEEIRRLKTENDDLRRAAESFGQLAERLNRQLRAERGRRVAADRHSAPAASLTRSLAS